MSDHDASIDGSLLRLQRESRGWTMTDMAMRSCLSVKQIRQLEEGGSESFYSEAVKLTAAKKVASLLGLSTAQVLGQPQHSLPSSPDALLQPSTVVDGLHSVHSDAEAHLQEIPSSSVEAVAQVEPEQPALTQAPKSTHMSLWVIAALFATALLVAAWLNPGAEPVVTEAEPPVQALPTDISESASAVVGVASDDAVNSASVASQTRVTGVQAASSAASSPSVRASDAAEAASR